MQVDPLMEFDEATHQVLKKGGGGWSAKSDNGRPPFQMNSVCIAIAIVVASAPWNAAQVFRRPTRSHLSQSKNCCTVRM